MFGRFFRYWSFGILAIGLALYWGSTPARQTPSPKRAVSEKILGTSSPSAVAPRPRDYARIERPLPAESKRREKELSRLKKQLALQPQDPQLLYEVGIRLARDFRAPEEATPFLEKSVRLNPKSGMAAYDLVGAYLETENASRGRRFFQELLEKDPGNAIAQAALADLLSASGDTMPALLAAQRAHALDPHSPSVTALLASVFEQADDARAGEMFLLAEQQQLARVRQIERDKVLQKRREILAAESVRLQDIQMGRADFLFHQGRLQELEEMSETSNETLRRHIDALLRTGRG